MNTTEGTKPADPGAIEDVETEGWETVWRSKDGQFQIDEERIRYTFEDGSEVTDKGGVELYKLNPHYDPAHHFATTDAEFAEIDRLQSDKEWLILASLDDPLPASAKVPPNVRRAWESQS